MTEISGLRLFLIQSSFVLLALCLLLANLLPLQTLPRSWAGPDLLLCFALAWSVRRPDYVPLTTLAVVFLLADFLLQRPPGLAAALMLLAAADMQARARVLRDAGFAAEWARVGLLVVGVTVLQQIVLLLFLANPPGLALIVSQAVLTILFYPICVAVSAGLMGVRMSVPGEGSGL